MYPAEAPWYVTFPQNHGDIMLSNTRFCQLLIAIILSAVVIALRTLRENSRVRRVEVLGRVFEYYSAPEVREARKVIRDTKLSSDFEKITKDQLYHIELVLLSLNQIGFFIRDAKTLGVTLNF
jgi:hypothetical protein